MFFKSVPRLTTILAIAANIAFPGALQAEQITLNFEWHGFTISGEFAGIMQNAYVVHTDLGELYVPFKMVTCEGPRLHHRS